MLAIYSKAREPMNFFTHFIGVVLSVVAISFIIYKSPGKDVADIIGSLIFGFSLICLYSASSIYHFVRAEEGIIKKLRKLDHSMIFVLIAGTYTPLCLKYMTYEKCRLFLAVLWAVALLGIVMKLAWMNAPRLLSTVIYLIMGWAVLFDIKSFMAIPSERLIFIFIGGLSYTIGAVIYWLKKPNPPNFGFHAIFHVFVIIGSFTHFIAIYN